MKQPGLFSRLLDVTTLAVTIASTTLFFPQPSFARDGISGCSVTEVGTEFNRSWRYTISLNVPEGQNCKVYIWNDHPGSGWQYCWNKSSAANPVKDTCGDLQNDPSFTGWKVQARCGDKTFTKPCSPGRRR